MTRSDRTAPADRRRGRAVVAVALGLMFAILGAGTARADDAPLLTESFEGGTLPAGWTFAQFSAGVSTAAVVEGSAVDGTHLLRIDSPSQNHARVEIPVALKASTTYRVSVMGRSTGVTKGGAAAVIGVDGTASISASAETSTWQRLDLYVRSGTDTDVKLTLGLGNFGQENQGTADFDQFTVTGVASAPAGASVVELNGPKPTVQPTAAQVPIGVGPNKAFWVALAILGAGTVAAVVLLTVGGSARRPEGIAP